MHLIGPVMEVPVKGHASWSARHPATWRAWHRTNGMASGGPGGLGCLRSSCCASLETSSMATLNRVHCQQQIQVPCQVIGLKRALTWLQCFTRFKRFDIFHGRGVCTINVQLSTLASSLSPCSFIRDTCRPSASRASPIDLVFLEKCQCCKEGDIPCDAQDKAFLARCCEGRDA